MGNLRILLFLAIFSSSCMAQRIAVSKSVSISSPKKLRKADQKELSSIVTNRLGKTEYIARSIAANPDDVYLVDDLVILVKSASIPRQPGILQEQKLARDDAAIGIKNFSSKIEKIGGRDVYVIDQIAEGVHIYRFTTVNKSENEIVKGFIQYKPGDEVKARNALEGIIKGLKFDSE